MHEASGAGPLDGRDIRARAEQQIAIERGEKVRKRDGAKAAYAYLDLA
jgi:hypothetical protein